MGKRFPVSRAAAYLGVGPGTLRRWEAEGRVSAERVNARGDRRFTQSALGVLLGGLQGSGPATPGVVLGCARISGRGGQVSSLAAQEAEIRAVAAAGGGVVERVVTGAGSGLSGRGGPCSSAGAGR